MPDINARLLQLNGLWVDMTAESLACIPALCEEIGREAGEPADVDPVLVRRTGLLAAKARQRLIDCLMIQIRTGSYSMSGELEVAPHVTTSGWEG